MKNTRLFFLGIFIFSALFLVNVLPQSQEIYNEQDIFSPNQWGSYSTLIGGLLKPVRTDSSGGQPSLSSACFPVLIVFVQFANEPEQCGYWPIGGVPTYMNRLIRNEKNTSSNYWEAYNPTTEPISSWWCEVSRGAFHVVGKAVNIVLDYDTSYYNNNGREDRVNMDVYEKLKLDTSIRWSNFDKWRKDGNGLYYNEPDNYVDMIYMVHRRCWANGPTYHAAGYTPLGSAGGLNDYPVYTDGSRTIYSRGSYDELGSGCKISGKLGFVDSSTVIGVMAHEHGHYLFGSGHITYSKMTYGLGGDYFYSPWERIKLGYIQPRVVNFSTTQNYSLGEYSGRTDPYAILKVPISTNDSSEFFLIANRMKLSPWDRIMEGDTAHQNVLRNINPEYGKGLYIYHITNDFNYPSSDITVMDEECADGLFYWSKIGTFVPDWIDPNNITQTMPFYKRDSVSYENDLPTSINTFFSKDERSLYDGTISSDTRKWGSEGKRNVNPGEDGTDRIFTNEKEAWTSRACFGDRWDAWKKGYNEIFSPYSSPSTNNWSNNSTGIFIWLNNQNGNDVDLKIYKAGSGGYNMNQILAVTPPSRPMGVKVEDYYPESGWCVPIVKWNHNKEPDMLRSDTTKRYRVYRATQPDMNSVPGNYIQIAEVYIHRDSTPSYIDSSILRYDCAFLDQVPPFGTKFPVRYEIKAFDTYGDSSVFSDFASTEGISPDGGVEDGGDHIATNENIPQKFNLQQNYPNPFNPVTNIKYDLPKDVYVKINIYDLLGREIKTLVNEFKQAGSYLISFNGTEFASGVYFYRIQAGSFIQVKRMVLIK